MTFRLAAVVLGGLAVLGTSAYAALDRGGDPPADGAAPDADVASEESEPESEPDATVELVSHDRTAEEPEPASEPESEPEPEAEEEEEDDGYWVGPPDSIPDCEAKLEEAGVKFEASRLPLHKTKAGIYCGAEQVVRYHKGPGSISWGGKPKVTCGVALAMARMETIVQEEAEREFSRPVKRIKHMGTYNCREMANYPGWVSEHSYGNAIDIKYFELRGGKKIPVLGEYPKNGAEPKDAKARFLKQVARRLYDEKVFSVVLTPSFDRAHRNHFHLDMARYLVDGT